MQACCEPISQTRSNALSIREVGIRHCLFGHPVDFVVPFGSRGIERHARPPVPVRSYFSRELYSPVVASVVFFVADYLAILEPPHARTAS